MKLIGMLVLALSMVGLGFGNAREIKRELAITEELLALVKHLHVQIKAYAKPLEDIYRGVDSPYLKSIGAISALRESGMANMAELLCVSVEQDTCRVIRELASGLGKTPSFDQIKLCAAAESELEAKTDKLRKSAGERVKLSLSLGLASALASVLLLI